MRTILMLLLVLFAVSCRSDDKPKPKPETAKEKQTRAFKEKAADYVSDDKPETVKEKQTRVFKEKAANYLVEVRAGAKLMDSSLTLNVAVAKQRELKELYAHLPDVPPDLDKTVNMADLLGSFDDGFGRAIVLVTARRDALRLKIEVEDRKLDSNDPAGKDRQQAMIRGCAVAADKADKQLKELSDLILDRVRLGQAAIDGDREVVAAYVKGEKAKQQVAEEEVAERARLKLAMSGIAAYDKFNNLKQRDQLIRDYNKELARLQSVLKVHETNLTAAINRRATDKDLERCRRLIAGARDSLAKLERNDPPYITPERAKQFKLRR